MNNSSPQALSGQDSSTPARDCATPEESDKEKIVRRQPTETGIYGACPFVTRYHTTGGIELHGRRRNAGVLRSSQGMRAAVGGGGLDLEGGGELDPVGGLGSGRSATAESLPLIDVLEGA
ncbi:hypothetical protein FIBSPDRAFT_905346 [Athelia psychrophila]|uniref:Uncharacterized protein n=1 Tax=Athelia psychrophila TaxID=1759441 RepID=A0A167TJE1_9AGAM|nr:hypothetical protein FIBSPDRAFT_905346 [Fibularhizoctonia sp. CBS 109695]